MKRILRYVKDHLWKNCGTAFQGKQKSWSVVRQKTAGISVIDFQDFEVDGDKLIAQSINIPTAQRPASSSTLYSVFGKHGRPNRSKPGGNKHLFSKI